MIYVYCASKSTGARDLAAALGGIRLRNFDGLNFWVKNKKIEPGQGDIVLCWGSKLPPALEGVKVLNGNGSGTKMHAALALSGNGVPTIKISPTQIDGTWLPRINDHEGGSDLLKPPTSPDFYVQKIDLAREYRVHSFCGKSIRAGVKIHREGFPNPHQWIRSFDAGWRIKYDDFDSTSRMRGLAHKAVKVLGLDFGAVDIGETAGGELVVLEVNRAPGVEGGSIDAYVRNIKGWIEAGGPSLKTPSEKGVKVQAPPPPAVPAPPLTAEQVAARVINERLSGSGLSSFSRSRILNSRRNNPFSD